VAVAQGDGKSGGRAQQQGKRGGGRGGRHMQDGL
jgi:hypothetical protein